MVKVSSILLCFLFVFQINCHVQKITVFSEIVTILKSNPNSLVALMVSRFKECDRCKLANDVLNQYAETTEGIVLTYLMDCDSIWKAEQDRVRVPSCDPDKKHELPSLTFFQPEINEFDIYNKKNKKQHKDTPYQGIFSPDALLQKTKELLPSFLKEITNMKELNQFLSIKSFVFKVIFFNDDEQTPLFFKALSSQFRGVVDFAVADGDNKKMKSQYGITRIPKMILLKLNSNSNEYEVTQYDEELNLQSTKQFVQKSLDAEDYLKNKEESEQGVYYDIPDNVEIQNIKANAIVNIVTKKNKERLVLLLLQKSDQNNPLLNKIKNDFKNMFKYYKVSCINKECEEVFPGLNKYPSIFVYSLSSNRKITDYERINEYDEKDDLSELLLNKVSYLQLSEGEVENDEQFRKQVNEGLDKELRYSAAFFYDKFDFFNKLSYFLVSQQQRFRKYLHFIRFVNPPDSDLENWSVQDVPGVVTILENNQQKQTFRRSPYEQPALDFKYMVDYFNQLCLQKQEDSLNKLEIAQITKQEDYEEKFLNNENKPCIIGLFDLSKEGKFKMDVEKLQKVRKLYADLDFTYGYIDAKCHREVLPVFKMNESQVNTLVYLDSKKSKFAILKQEFEIDNIIQFLEQIKDKKNLKSILQQMDGQIDLDEKDCERFNIQQKELFQQERQKKVQNKYKDL